MRPKPFPKAENNGETLSFPYQSTTFAISHKIHSIYHGHIGFNGYSTTADHRLSYPAAFGAIDFAFLALDPSRLLAGLGRVPAGHDR